MNEENKLTEKEENFCFAYVYITSFDAEEAVTASGYSTSNEPSTIKNHAKKLITNKEVKKLINEMIRERDDIPIVDRHWWFQKVKTVVDQNEKMPATQLKALEMLGKALGLFNDKLPNSNDADNASSILQKAIDMRKTK